MVGTHTHTHRGLTWLLDPMAPVVAATCMGVKPSLVVSPISAPAFVQEGVDTMKIGI